MDDVMIIILSQFYDDLLFFKSVKVVDLKKTVVRYFVFIYRSFYMNFRVEGEDSDIEYINFDFFEDV